MTSSEQVMGRLAAHAAADPQRNAEEIRQLLADDCRVGMIAVRQLLADYDRLAVDVADAERRGYAQAIAKLRDDERFRHWWTAQPTDHPCRYWGGTARGHLADYLEVVGADG